MKYLVFDFGGTLAEYKGLPPCWVDSYPDAFEHLGKLLECNFSEEQIKTAIEILQENNARINPRTHEIPAEIIFEKVNQVLEINKPAAQTAGLFYSYFQKKLFVYEETKAVLNGFREKGIKIAVLSDLPTAMPHESFLEDLSKLEVQFDSVQSSQSVGFRKPEVKGLELIARDFNCSLNELWFIGDEKKDIETIKKAGGKAVLINRTGETKTFGEDLQIKTLRELQE